MVSGGFESVREGFIGYFRVTGYKGQISRYESQSRTLELQITSIDPLTP